MKIAIIGPGALGCLLVAGLHKIAAEVWLVDYRPDRAAYLQSHGVRLTTLDGQEQHFPVKCTCQANAVGPCDLAILSVKAHQTKNAAQSLPPLMGRDGLALTLQNGIGNLEQMAAVVGPERLLAGVIMHGVTLLDWGRARHAGSGKTLLGIPPGSQVTSEQLAEWVSRFQAAGFDCQGVADIVAVIWDKLLVNVGVNPLTALTRLLNGGLLEVPEAWEVAAAAVQEAQAVAQAADIAISPDPLPRVRQVCQATAGNRSSMLQDVLAQRPTEIEALNGRIVALGQRLKVSTPVNAILSHLIRALEKSYRPSSE
ncbi:MAG: ketopantoate reductase family protein [Desulfobacteraceae bacterium]